MRIKNVMNKKRLDVLMSPFSKDAKYDILGLILACVVAVLSLYLVPPEGTVQWILKGAEITGIFSAAYAIGLMINKFVVNREKELEKVRLEELAKREGVTLDEYLDKQLSQIMQAIEKWAKIHKVKYKSFKSSSYKHTISFEDFLIDYIDVYVADYKLNFLVRSSNIDILRELFDYVAHTELKLSFVFDDFHIGSDEKMRVNMDSARTVMSVLVNSILNPVHTRLYL